MLIELESLVTGIRLLPLSMAGMTLPLLAEIPGKVLELVDPPKRPATFAPDASPMVSVLVVVIIVGVTQLIPWYYWRKFVRIRNRSRSLTEPVGGDHWQSPLQDRETELVETDASPPVKHDHLFDARLSLRTEVGLAVVAYILPALLLSLALILGSP